MTGTSMPMNWLKVPIYRDIGAARKCLFHYLDAGIEKSLACMNSLCLEALSVKSRHECVLKEIGTEMEF